MKDAHMCSTFSEIYTFSMTFIGLLCRCNFLLINYISYIVCSKIHDYIDHRILYSYFQWLIVKKKKCSHLCPIVLHSKREDYQNKVAYYLKVLADTFSECCNSSLVFQWCYRLVFRTSWI
jgi:hypothetical protein